jgi:hypothetical protein
MRWVALVVVLAGCDRLLNLDMIQDAARGDAPVLDTRDGPIVLCPPPDVSDNFEDATPVCGTWGTADNVPGWLSRASGRLVVAPTPGVAAFVGCTENARITLGSNGVFAHVVAVGSDNSYGILEIKTYGNVLDSTPNADTTFAFSSTAISLYDQDTCPSCQNIASAGYVVGEMDWFALVPVKGGTVISAQYSHDGLMWHELGQRPLPAANTAMLGAVTVGGGASAMSTAPTSTQFESFDVCPGAPGA